MPDLSSAEQLAGLHRLAQDHGLDTIVLRDPATLSWLTGARWHIQQSLHTSCFDLVLTGLDRPSPAQAQVRIVTNVIEAPRLREVECVDLVEHGAEIETVAWDQDRARRLPTGPEVGADQRLAGATDLSEQVATLRRVLTAQQRTLLAELAAEATRLVGEVARTVRPGQTERAVAGRLVGVLVEAGIDPVVYFVGSDERLARHKHPLATAREVESLVMLACVVRRHGLVASVTRLVALTPLTHHQREVYERLLHVEAELLDASVAGATLGEAFAAGARAYARHGFPAEEWRHHHQGGLSGFAPRAELGRHGSSTPLTSGTVLAWNPSAAGWKVEDTTLVTPSGPLLLDLDPAWPSIEVAGRSRPAVLQL